jgi:predicted nucleotidyltransferase/HEPN domain-containing protein
LKTEIDYLPVERQKEVHEIIEAVRQRFPAEMIILFGSFARGNWVDDQYLENGTVFEYKSDYDILVVVDTEVIAIRKESNKRWQNKLRHDTSSLNTPLNVIFHGIEFLNSEIENGNYFFIEILREGIMLYDSGKFKLSTPKPLNPADRKHKANTYYQKWVEDAEMFLLDFEANFERGISEPKYLRKAAFELHQAAERLYACILLVHIDYKPKTHDLEKLDRHVCKIDSRLKTVFTREHSEGDRLFQLLKKAYIESRYKLDYTINQQDLEDLSERVKKLFKLTEISCKEKIASFK